MPRTDVSTSMLLQRIFKTASFDRFIKRHGGDMDKNPPFHEYINELCREKGVTAEQIIKRTDIVRTYGHQLFNGTRKPTRDRVIQLAFGLELSYEQTQKLLTIARKSTLYPKIKRDAIIIYALNHGYSIREIQAALFELSLPALGEER